MAVITLAEGATPRVKDARWRIRAKLLSASRTASSAASTAPGKDTRQTQWSKMERALTGNP